MDIGERTEQLVYIELDFEDWHDRLHLVEVTRGTVHSLGNEFEYEVEIDFVLLWLKRLATHDAWAWLLVDTYPLAVVVKEGFEFDNVGVPDDAHNLQLTVLLRVSECAIGIAGVSCAD
jgi:hypothetical protein